MKSIKYLLVLVLIVAILAIVLPGQSKDGYDIMTDRGPTPVPIEPTIVSKLPEIQPTVMPEDVEKTEIIIEKIDIHPLASELNRVLGTPLSELSKLDAIALLELYKINADKLGVIVLDQTFDKETGEATIEKVAGTTVFKPDSYTEETGYPAPGISNSMTTTYYSYLPLVIKGEPNLETRIEEAKDLAKGYIDNLYQDNSWWGYVKEYPAIPVSIKNTGHPSDYRSNRLAGHYYQVTSQPVGKVLSTIIGYDYESQYITFEEYYSWGYGEPNLLVMEAWDETGQTTMYIQKVSWTGDTAGYEDVYLGDTLIWQDVFIIPNDTTVAVYIGFDTLPAHRYTVRHATKLGSYFYNAYTDPYKVQQLTYTYTQYGFTVYPDVYAPLFETGTTAGYAYFYTNDAYHDCDLVNDGMDSTMSFGYGPHRYPYESKVCVLGRAAYISLSRADYLVPALQALHVLNKYGNPDYVYSHPLGGPTTPRQMARDLETFWNGYGMPAFLKDPYYASAIRTNAFVALESKLGYLYGDNTSKTYADQGIEILLSSQIGRPTASLNAGEIWTEQGAIYRPNQTGGQLLSWVRFLDPENNSYYAYMLSPKTFLSDLVDLFSMPNETEALLISNAETTLSYWAALNIYQKYRW